jgi:hypothetical protein
MRRKTKERKKERKMNNDVYIDDEKVLGQRGREMRKKRDETLSIDTC